MKFTVKQIIDITAIAVTALILLITIPSCFFSVQEQERAVVTRFGKPIATHGPGLRFKLPFIESVHKVSTVTKAISVGYQEGPNQTTRHVEAESFMITNDFNFINVDFYVEYRVTDPVKYLFASGDPELILRNLVQAEIRTVVSEYAVDDVLTLAKAEIQTNIRDRVISDLEETDIGISLVNVSMQDAEPPTEEVIVAFKNVESARQQADTFKNQATREYNEAIPAARAEADLIEQEAIGYKQSRINEAIGQTARFNEMFNEYMKNKEITRTRLYLEALEEILPGVKLIVGSDGTVLPLLDLTHETTVAAPERRVVNEDN
ncbi:MAG: FtsH protease activity modulator HflK [Defluviitaleaceae bacterium]|nr:FtsH protease activity modulator HflK [Defluviitaleaceae bacterium]